ncbi:MAG: branched-chain amino acid transport system ATP-binding protein [Frankiales bacterium]|nr:branched-chain amino acid transport system ATP-binding protein [Frankiales bacterium]
MSTPSQTVDLETYVPHVDHTYDPRDPEVALYVDDVSVRFGGVQAVSSATIAALAGQVTGLIGPNGAGKTTTFNVITGLESPTNGRVWLANNDVSSLPPYKRARRGLARTFQRLEVFGTLTARDNILAAAEFRRSWAHDHSDPRQVADELIERVGLGHVQHERVDMLPTGLARLVELGRGLATRPTVLLLDEPGSGLDTAESEALGDLLIELAQEGIAVLVVEHDVDLVMRVCNRIHVLDFGRIICVGYPKDVQADPAVQAAYLGAED